MDESPALARDEQLNAVGALSEPSRRSLYDYVVSAGSWVGRDEAADASGMQRGVAAHHLDRLADDGLLEVDYQRLTGRSGPGAGRPAKVYRRSPRDFAVTLPQRAYEFAGRMLADALAESLATGGDVSSAVDAAALAAGRQLGQAMTDRARSLAEGDDAVVTVLAVLREYGFEPQADSDGTIVLRNCPFHLLAQRHTDLICGINHALIKAALDELGETGLRATLEPNPDTCCVRLDIS